MCNLSYAIEKRGIEQGIEQAKRDMAIKLKNIFFIKEIADIVELPEKTIEQIISGE